MALGPRWGGCTGCGGKQLVYRPELSWMVTYGGCPVRPRGEDRVLFAAAREILRDIPFSIAFHGGPTQQPHAPPDWWPSQEERDTSLPLPSPGSFAKFASYINIRKQLSRNRSRKSMLDCAFRMRKKGCNIFNSGLPVIWPLTERRVVEKTSYGVMNPNPDCLNRSHCRRLLRMLSGRTTFCLLPPTAG